MRQVCAFIPALIMTIAASHIAAQAQTPDQLFRTGYIEGLRLYKTDAQFRQELESTARRQCALGRAQKAAGKPGLSKSSTTSALLLSQGKYLLAGAAQAGSDVAVKRCPDAFD